MATQVQKMGGILTAVVLGGLCEPNDQLHRLVDMFAARAGPGAEAETRPDSKSAAVALGGLCEHNDHSIGSSICSRPEQGRAGSGGGGKSRLEFSSCL
jgi:hypothetical protein